MKKIPNIYERDDAGKILIGTWRAGTLWVHNGEGRATRKFDGTACLIREGILYKRFDRKLIKDAQNYKDAPLGWEACQDPDPVTGHWPGWLPVGDGPEDRWHREAWGDRQTFVDGTYELVGPKIQGNRDKFSEHVLKKHGAEVIRLETLVGSSATFEEVLRSTLELHEIEGIVFHHQDGRMAKIRRVDFGLPWPVR